MMLAGVSTMLLAALGLVLVFLALVLLRPRTPPDVRLERRRVVCPARSLEATVEFLVDVSRGEVYEDVVGCSLLPGYAPVRCEKVCRSTSVAPFGRPVAA